jgi:ABC-type branched-subunit amino acid transport system ATPase component
VDICGLAPRPAAQPAVAAALRRNVDERGTGIPLVEHDMRLVMALCEYIYVMDFGRKIFEAPRPRWRPATWCARLTSVRKLYLSEPPNGGKLSLPTS